MGDLEFENRHDKWAGKDTIMWFIHGRAINLFDYESVINTALIAHFEREEWELQKKKYGPSDSVKNTLRNMVKGIAKTCSAAEVAAILAAEGDSIYEARWDENPYLMSDPPPPPDDRTVEQKQRAATDDNLRSIFG
jgi:hypothetical protein